MNRAFLRPPKGLLLGFSLSLLFLVFSYLRGAGDLQSMVFGHAAFQAVFDGPIIGTLLGTRIAWFVAALVVLHLAFGSFCWALARATMAAFPGKQYSPRQLTALWFIIACLCLLVWNAGVFKRSSLGEPYAQLAAAELFGIACHAWVAGLFIATASIVIVLASYQTLRAMPVRTRVRYAGWAAAPVLLGVVALTWPQGTVPEAPADKPNIIFLGVDSLRYDEPGRDPQARSNTPNIDAFLGDAVRFDNAITPLARTFPSWVALLTGRHPHTTGAILNLLPADQIHRGQTLPELLRTKGYSTAYAIDEVRFSNIDETYGFDQTATPRIGSADFILGTASDTPLLNLVINTRLGKWMFPFAHANRAVAKLYEPDTFVARIRDDIELSSPMFFAAHMTLPHWPYQWHDSKSYSWATREERPQYYLDAVHRADDQFGAILDRLEERGMLRNAIVVAFSDHGETFNSTSDVLIPPDDPVLSETRATPNWGHGTTVLSPHQYRAFLAMRGYGKARGKLGVGASTTHVAATIEDVTPTLLELLGWQSREAVDGLSLLGSMRGTESPEARFARRVRFTETEFNPLNLVSIDGAVDAVNASSLADAANYYRVDSETDRLEMKPKFLDVLRRNRQFAAMGWSQLLGVFPSPSTSSYSFLVVDLKGGTPKRMLQVEDFQRDEETRILWDRLCARYHSILDSGTQAIKCSVPGSLVHLAKPGS